MSRPPKWMSGTTYTSEQVTHEGVVYTCIYGHIASPANEPDNGLDPVWQTVWQAQTPMWGDFLYGRLPAWLRSLDAGEGVALYRFLRVFGRSLNITQGEIQDFVLLKDPDFCPTQYLDNFAATLGFLLPHAVDEASQRRFLGTAAAFYRRKGTLRAVEYIATRYLGITVTIAFESVSLHQYTVTYDETPIPIGDRPIIRGELERILLLYEPAGLVHSINPPPSTIFGVLNLNGDLDDSFGVSGNP